MVRGIPNITVPTLSLNVAQGGKMSLPVDSSSLIYSHFEHVSGVPAPRGTEGVKISKLNLLDVLIGQINQINRGSPAIKSPNSAGASSPDMLIEVYRNQLRQIKAASAAMPYIQSPGVQSGALFSLFT